MDLLLKPPVLKQDSHIAISGSKSETNRLLLLQALFPDIVIENASDSDDSLVMKHALLTNEDVIDVHHAGTAMRFLTAYFSIQPGREIVLTGSQRMKERPIAILVEALRALGAKIEYIEKDGYPPLKISGTEIIHNKVSLKADVSSQYITALLLIAPKLKNGLEVTLQGKTTSLPYINMTLELLRMAGVDAKKQDDIITINPALQKLQAAITVESDWSSASYYYSIAALAKEGTKITLSSYRQNSFQGDSALIDIYDHLGVKTAFKGNTIMLSKIKHKPETLVLDLNNTPDIAQTIAVTCFGLGIGCHLTGLHTLKIKEADRLEALKSELTKLGAEIQVTDNSLILEPSSSVNQGTAIETYNDHRMAMAFAPLALKVPVIIKGAEVVSKSYPAFWDDLKTIGIVCESL